MLRTPAELASAWAYEAIAAAEAELALRDVADRAWAVRVAALGGGKVRRDGAARRDLIVSTTKSNYGSCLS